MLFDSLLGQPVGNLKAVLPHFVHRVCSPLQVTGDHVVGGNQVWVTHVFYLGGVMAASTSARPQSQGNPMDESHRVPQPS
jgi:hypothetical protein